MDTTYTTETSLADRVNLKLAEMRMSKQELAILLNENRTTMSNYLNFKNERIAKAKIEELEQKLEEFLRKEGDAAGVTGATIVKCSNKKIQKTEIFESRDFRSIIGVCTSCQENHALGIVVGKSGYGKTHALKYFARLPRVVHIECNETMNCKDIVRKIERSIGLPKTYGSIDERLEHITSFFNTNQGYLLIVDEADKLISKYTQKKIEMLRYIADGASVGIVIAGEPMLESAIKAYDNRFANRMDFYYKLRGLSKEELQKYFEPYNVENAAMDEFYIRACKDTTGCFRRLDRTLNNVIRILKENDKNVITLGTIREASNMMML